MFPKKKSRLSPQGKPIAAAQVLLESVEGRLDEKAAGKRLREEVGLQWSYLTCIQYLSGQEALAAIESLPKGWEESGRTQVHLLGAAVLAAHTVANLRSDGTSLCASYLAHELKGKAVEQWLAEKSDTFREEV
ncbi:hypothetical protein [Xanthomonas arboricola]|uniref:Uncharacterized protein n=1 Tax=Xanthomonas arboricola pv. corylina TaxID=487821 RepID=A0ABM8RZU8_9XANT|nr:hypothetical protein [Xanthomonas arboricola]MDN0209735.1 hypothetical protein [Xanthomonas arboricola pv. corylina]MDN0214059.1 hypothetical protein [Xanthomonas arboricola pv. corylina]UQQ12716.1 hypothetical protein KP021_11360 [Xanthomonas arboricola pv. corylina]CAE6780640.1 hypothetical protein XAC301_23910 [Xanthomonas arboricola pv. corylina]CAE6780660.1 hypothetical protein XAC301_23910 [Xanthomonas arboricola pv. corylina]